LGEFSDIGWLFTSVSSLKIAGVAHNNGLLFSWYKYCITFDKKMVWAAFWDDFSQTRLVTLPGAPFRRIAKSIKNLFFLQVSNTENFDRF
jgi:hypothetical protein